MTIKINEDAVKQRMVELSLDTYQDVAEKAQELGYKLSHRMIYYMLNDENWSRDKLAALCAALRCEPADIVAGWANGTSGSNGHTHDSPQPVEEQKIEERVFEH